MNTTPTKAEHTKTPWRMIPDESPYLIMHPTRRGVTIATVSNEHKSFGGFMNEQKMMNDEDYAASEAEGWDDAQLAEMAANAKLILKAVNSHSALVEACRDVSDAWRGIPEGNLAPSQRKALEAVSKALENL